MSIRSSILAGLVTTAVAGAASADIVVGWTINTAFPTGAGNVPTGTTYTPPNPAGAGLAETGANIAGSQLRAVKSLAASTYTSPAGNGSQYAFSSNNWTTGDAYEVRFSAVGFTDLSVSWDQARSGTGPAAFRLLVSVDGGISFAEIMSYTVLQSGGGGSPATWSSTTYNPLYSNTASLGAAANELGLVIVRFQNFEAAPSAGSGSNRIDNIFINGSVIPTPGAIALIGLAGLAARRRR
jgi:hypothetical protein